VKKTIISWCNWFFLSNTLILWSLGLNYHPTLQLWQHSVPPLRDQIWITSFMFSAYLGQLGLLAILPAFLILPLASIFPYRRIIFFLSICLSSSVAIFLVLDSITYNLYRFHFNGIVMDLVIHGFREQILGISAQEYWFGLKVIAVVILSESLMGYVLWRILKSKDVLTLTIKKACWPVLFLVSCLIFSYSIIIFSADPAYTDAARFLPLYSRDC
jgi:membrane-anchored protein YejM (alkaline phosphatase superfamily)